MSARDRALIGALCSGCPAEDTRTSLSPGNPLESLRDTGPHLCAATAFVRAGESDRAVVCATMVAHAGLAIRRRESGGKEAGSCVASFALKEESNGAALSGAPFLCS